MTTMEFDQKVKQLFEDHEAFVTQKNSPILPGNGIFLKYKNPVVTREHAPVHWRYDLDQNTNPYLMERLGINSAFNAGAIEFNGEIVLCLRTEGVDRKSFFAMASSKNGVDNFRFWDHPIIFEERDERETNLYDMRFIKHEDGWIYGMFCTEMLDPNAPRGDLSSAIAQCGIVRSKDLKHFDRLPDLKTKSPQQRNCVLHPEFVNGKYAFYTRPLTDFAATNSGDGIGFGLADDIENAVVDEEVIFERRYYHTIKEGKNGQGPAPIKTEKGWLHLAHGVRNTAAGYRYVLYLLLTDLNDPTKILASPGGHLIAPYGSERVGDVSNVVFTNGWVARENGEVLIYYASADTRMHVATTTIDKLLDYVFNTPEDKFRTMQCARQRDEMINKNLKIMREKGWR